MNKLGKRNSGKECYLEIVEIYKAGDINITNAKASTSRCLIPSQPR
jgi:hypothetical protein